MGNSLGFWVEAKGFENTSNFEGKFDLHINYWSLEAKESCHYLDIGVKFEKNLKQKFTSLNFYFPFYLARDDYMSSLGEIITKNDDLMELIFNERLVGTKEGKVMHPANN